MTDRLLTEQERHNAWANSDSPAHGEMALIEAQDAKSVAACNQEWQEKIEMLRQYLLNEYHICFTPSELLEAME